MQRSLFLVILMGQCSYLTYQWYECHFIEREKTWSEAQTYCRENNTDLATVSNKADMNRLRKSAENQKEVWIRPHNPEDTGANNNNNPDQRKCDMLDKEGREKKDDCMKKKYFFCCHDKVILINKNKTWEEALYYCRENHRDLVSITDSYQQKRVEQKARRANSPYIWLGLRYTCTLDFWFWVSDEVVSFEEWDSDGQINDCDMSGAMEREGHKWFKKNDNEKFNFICFTL